MVMKFWMLVSFLLFEDEVKSLGIAKLEVTFCNNINQLS